MIIMFIAFGHGKCPLCGDAGASLAKETYHCRRCFIAFNDYAISSLTDPNENDMKFWN